MYPKLQIDILKLRHNVATLSDMCRKRNISLAMVTKVYCAMPEVVSKIVKDKVDYIADSRIRNIKNLKDISIPKILIRIPMQSELEEVVKYADISFNSEIDTIYRLDQEAKLQDKKHGVVLMFDLGDLREGYFNEDDFLDAVGKVLKLRNINFYGIGTNLTCYGAILPSPKNLSRLVSIAKKVEEKYKIKVNFVSGGNSSTLKLLQSEGVPKGITNLRIGEAIALGYETSTGCKIKNTYQDAFKLVCEVVELKNKPSVPIGEIGKDAFGNVPCFEDKGIITRAIVGIGKQDVKIDGLTPLDEKIEILGASSDHMLLNVNDSQNSYKVGDKIEFLVNYGALLSISTSKYVEKELVNCEGYSEVKSSLSF